MIRNKIPCCTCGREISKSNMSKHILACGKTKPKTEPKFNPRNTGKIGKNQFTKAKSLGLPVPVMSEATRKKISESGKGRIESFELRQKRSNSMRQAVIANPNSYSSANVCGRIKIEEYCGQKFHGRWEVIVAKWFDANNIRWKRDVSPFSYFWNNGWHLYFPDFFLPDYNLFIEVKGYETDRDRTKWAVVPNLLTIKQKEIKLIKQNIFHLNKERYGTEPPL